MTVPFRYDSAAAISKGARDYQEDAIIADFMTGSDVGLAVLADGMGGHAAGDVASKVVVTEVFRELTFRRDALADSNGEAPDVLKGAAQAANDCLSRLVKERPERAGMGATLLGIVFTSKGLNWVSVGDSPLYLFRDNSLRQLNEDHSMGPHIEYMVRSGAISEQEGANHPDRNVLTSVLSGQKIASIDCPVHPFALQAGDVIIAASDGLQFLQDDEISRIIRELPLGRSAEIADGLMNGVTALGDPDLDNVTVLAIQVRNAEPAQRPVNKQRRNQDEDPRPRLWPFGKAVEPLSPKRPKRPERADRP